MSTVLLVAWEKLHCLNGNVCFWRKCSSPQVENLSGSHKTKSTQKGSTLALKPRADVIRSPKQGYQWLHEKDLCPPKFFFKKVENLQAFLDEPVFTEGHNVVKCALQTTRADSFSKSAVYHVPPPFVLDVFSFTTC